MMSLYTTRFAHAGNLRLDQPLNGVGPLTTAARSIIQNAPATAWERVVAACLEQDVDFLLLTPRTLAGAPLISDRRTLYDGFQRLGEQGIPVFWALADETISDRWRSTLPENVTILDESNPLAALAYEGRTIASFFFGDTQPQTPDQRPATVSLPGDQPLRIMIPENPEAIERVSTTDGASDYAAGWGATAITSQKIGGTLWNDPGTPVGRNLDEAGGGGVSVVEWQNARVADVIHVPTAPVRWERCLLVVGPETTREELIERLQLALLEREPGAGDQLWFVHWHIAGSGPCMELLHDPANRSEIELAVESVFGEGKSPLRVHRWELPSSSTATTDSLASMLHEWFDGQAVVEWSSIRTNVEARLGSVNTRGGSTGLLPIQFESVREEAERLLSGWMESR